jgi:hypothetical protein
MTNSWAFSDAQFTYIHILLVVVVYFAWRKALPAANGTLPEERVLLCYITVVNSFYWRP